LATTHPDLCKELVDPADGLKYSAGSNKKVKWFCDKHGEEYTWSATISNRTGHKNGCGACAVTGYDASKPGSLYVLRDKIQGRDCVQFGISNVIEKRLVTHKRSGFKSAPLKVFNSNDGALIGALEKEMKAEQARRSIPTCTKSGIKFDGSTEAFITNSPEADGFLDWILEEVSRASESLGAAASPVQTPRASPPMLLPRFAGLISG
jgi:hypothetical protein